MVARGRARAQQRGERRAGEHVYGVELTAKARAAVEACGAASASSCKERLAELASQWAADAGGRTVDTLAVRLIHAQTVAAAGDVLLCRELLREVVEDASRVLGRDHELTLRVRAAGSTHVAVGDGRRGAEGPRRRGQGLGRRGTEVPRPDTRRTPPMGRRHRTRARPRPSAQRLRPPGGHSFELVDAAHADAVCAAVRVVTSATSLGGVESTIERRAKLLGQEHVPPGLLRLSVGCEHVEDLWDDLTTAITATRTR
ncbi:PLP-dependent transferase [Embleya sp. NPDC050154]|uniref:PLP-dependent transferase n=1 Tax=Embleya sp. NPDC050154 TaxID=3363988 RepID=UPI00378D395D